ncbi:hypothetical protein T484DRAFT_1636888, partial [Baffinella frigidus]
LNPTPYTLHPTHYTLPTPHSTPHATHYTLHPPPSTLHPPPSTLVNPQPSTPLLFAEISVEVPVLDPTIEDTPVLSEHHGENSKTKIADVWHISFQ